MTVLAAAWTLAVVKHLAESGADSATLFETTGWRGVMAGDAGTPLPARFPSLPGRVFPVFDVLAAINAPGHGAAIPTASSDPLAVGALTLTGRGTAASLVYNLSHRPRPARLEAPGPVIVQLPPWSWTRVELQLPETD